jgi:glutathione synthase/RimK-type ligase-like ATP-grasp enzyme
MTRNIVLILGSAEDEHASAVMHAVRQRGFQAEYLDSRWFPGAMTLSLDPASGGGTMTLPNHQPIPLDRVRSVYWRNYFGVFGPDLPDPDQAFIAQNDSRGLFESLLIHLPARWVNGWQGFQLHQTKPVQLARVAALGVPIPPTTLTNDPDEVKAFAARHPRSIVKPVQGGDQTQRLRPEHLTDVVLQNLRLSPITVQAEVPGTNIRVFVAGERVLACEVRTDEVDYRQDQRPQLLVHSLPDDIAAQSLRIARQLDLLWTGIDFRLTPAGQYVFLEANPSPMFLGFQSATGLPLLESLTNLLVA